MRNLYAHSIQNQEHLKEVVFASNSFNLIFNDTIDLPLFNYITSKAR